jgi:hypothetical protein
MARYSAFLGRKVEVHYRAGDILLPASGMFVADSGRSIFLEQHMEQRGQMKQFRWEIPYQYIVRLEERSESPDATNGAMPAPGVADNASKAPSLSGDAARAGSGDPQSIIPLRHRPKPA